MRRRLVFLVPFAALSGPLFAVACTHDFDGFVSAPGDAASGDDGGSGEGGGSRDGGTACGAPQTCLEEAGTCVIACDKTRDQCNTKCTNNGCRQQCQNASLQCRASCASDCTQCSSAAGCNGATDCNAATK